MSFWNRVKGDYETVKNTGASEQVLQAEKKSDQDLSTSKNSGLWGKITGPTKPTLSDTVNKTTTTYGSTDQTYRGTPRVLGK